MHSLGVHLALLIYLSVSIAAVVSGFREESAKEIIQGTWQRGLKFIGFTALIVALMLLVEWLFL